MNFAKIILLAHGSRDSRWRLPFEAIITDLRKEHGDDVVELAYMEFCSPTLRDIIQKSYADGFRHIKILPLFLAGGSHLKNDIPEIINAVRNQIPDLVLEQLKPVGESPEVSTAMKQVIINSISGV